MLSDSIRLSGGYDYDLTSLRLRHPFDDIRHDPYACVEGLRRCGLNKYEGCSISNEKRSDATQWLRAGCGKAEPKIFAPPQIPFPRAQDGQNLISWRWSVVTTRWRSMHAISSYRGNRPTKPQTHIARPPARPLQTGPITIHWAAAS